MTLEDDIHHERELRELWQKAHLVIHSSESKATEIAKKEVDRRLEEMNQIREQINKERGIYVLRQVYDEQHNTLRDLIDARLKVLETNKSNMEGRLWTMGAALSAVVVVVNLAIYYLTRK